MRAAALIAWAKKIRPEWEVEVFRPLEGTGRLYRFGVELYNWIQRNGPYLHHLYFNYLEWAGMCSRPAKILGKERFQEEIRLRNPDVVLSVHGTLNHGYMDLVRECLGNRVVCGTYCGELFGGYGFSKHWVNPELDFFLGAMPETQEAAKRLKMSDERAKVGGFLLRPRFYLPLATREEAKTRLVKEFGFRSDRFTVMLATGAQGAQNHLSFLNAMRKAGLDVQVLALCGRSELNREKIKTWSREFPDFAVCGVGYVEDMLSLMHACDVVVARGGTGTTSETILAGVPLIVNGMGGIMPQEWITVKFLRKHGIGLVARRPSRLVVALRQLLEDKSYRQKMVETIHGLRPEGTPEQILSFIEETWQKKQNSLGGETGKSLLA